MTSLLLLITFLAPIITGLTQLLKSYVNIKYYALIPIVLGIILGPASFPLLPLIGLEPLSIAILLWAGLLTGLTAAGFYSAQNIRNK